MTNVETEPFVSQNAVMLTKDDVWSDDDEQPKKKKIRAFKIKSADQRALQTQITPVIV